MSQYRRGIVTYQTVVLLDKNFCFISAAEQRSRDVRTTETIQPLHTHHPLDSNLVPRKWRTPVSWGGRAEHGCKRGRRNRPNKIVHIDTGFDHL